MQPSTSNHATPRSPASCVQLRLCATVRELFQPHGRYLHELPLFYTYLVSEPKNQNGEKNHKSKKSHWNKIDAAFPHKEGKGHDVVLDGGGKIVLRMRKKKKNHQSKRSTSPSSQRP